MQVQVREECRDCGGAGVVQGAMWGVYFADAEQQQLEQRHHDAGDHDKAADAYAAWWAEHGYDANASAAFPTLGDGTPLPAEEEPCSECEGRKYVTRWLELGELVDALREVDHA